MNPFVTLLEKKGDETHWAIGGELPPPAIHVSRRAKAPLRKPSIFQKSWSVPRKNWTGNMNFSNRSQWFKTRLNNSGRGQADDSLPGSGAGSPRLCPSWKGGVL
jgi:hypothetical protein